MAVSRGEQLAEQILEVVRSEFPEKAAHITLDAAIGDVDIDSVDLITLLFRLEDTYNVEIEFDLRNRPQTVGDLINFVIGFINAAEPGDAAGARVTAL